MSDDRADEAIDPARLRALDERVVSRWRTSSKAAAKRELLPHLAPQATRVLVIVGAMTAVSAAGIALAVVASAPEPPTVRELRPAPPADARTEPSVATAPVPTPDPPAARDGAPPASLVTTPHTPRTASARPVRAAAPAPAPSAPPSPLAEAAKAAEATPRTETSLIRDARALLDEEPSAALALAAEHRAAFPRGVLVVERTRIEVSALIALGRLDDAAARIEELRAREPGAAAVPVMTRLLERARRGQAAPRTGPKEER